MVARRAAVLLSSLIIASLAAAEEEYIYITLDNPHHRERRGVHHVSDQESALTFDVFGGHTISKRSTSQVSVDYVNDEAIHLTTETEALDSRVRREAASVEVPAWYEDGGLSVRVRRAVDSDSVLVKTKKARVQRSVHHAPEISLEAEVEEGHEVSLDSLAEALRSRRAVPDIVHRGHKGA